MVRIWISMIREPGDCLQANKTAPATSSGSSMSELLTLLAETPRQLLKITLGPLSCGLPANER
jgi:hypothetical protein